MGLLAESRQIAQIQKLRGRKKQKQKLKEVSQRSRKRQTPIFLSFFLFLGRQNKKKGVGEDLNSQIFLMFKQGQI